MKPKREKIDIFELTTIIEKYCNRNELSFEKIKTQKITNLGETIVFSHPVEKNSYIRKLGLMVDKETQPKPTLILRKTENGYIVEKTEFTNIYLK